MTATARAGFSLDDKWLVGLEVHGPDSQAVWLYYVVDQASDAIDAIRLALRRANSTQERRDRGGTVVRPERFEVQRIYLDASGRLRLVRCC
ncbi:hypothetical protein [Streptomyces sp. AK02-01A]|uniref:hypothetical protein n=1 Tax=Streptomyces sp. AK02-01A TaxID=3028648 RepID=UPI0029A73FA3|nr:hypothetical protein [Streptomyces sp. AK02-01A]MDX3852700.1 hypothetical protein [Streptomyces sp. AK02-01A]